MITGLNVYSISAYNTSSSTTDRLLFPRAATMLGQVVEAALQMPALRQVCVHCNRAVQRRRDWLYCSQQLHRVVKARAWWN